MPVSMFGHLGVAGGESPFDATRAERTEFAAVIAMIGDDGLGAFSLPKLGPLHEHFETHLRTYLDGVLVESSAALLPNGSRWAKNVDHGADT